MWALQAVDPFVVQDVCSWISAVTGETIRSFREALTSGRLLCVLMAKAVPGALPDMDSDQDFLEHYLRCGEMECQGFGPRGNRARKLDCAPRSITRSTPLCSLCTCAAMCRVVGDGGGTRECAASGQAVGLLSVFFPSP